MERRYYKIFPDKEGNVSDIEYAKNVVDDVLWIVENCSDKIYIDITDVSCMTIRFAALSFGGIWSNLGDEEFNRRIDFIGGNETVMIAVETGIRQAVSKKQRTGGVCSGGQITCKDAMRLVIDKIYSLHSDEIDKINEKIQEAAANGWSSVKVMTNLARNEMAAVVLYYKEHGFRSSNGADGSCRVIWVSWCDVELRYE